MSLSPPPRTRDDEPAAAPVPVARRGRLAWAWRVLSVRLRFLAVLGVAVAAVAGWDVLRAYWGKLTAAAWSSDPGMQAVSGDTEYFCPMDPGVVSDWPGKCGICNMALVRRKRGDVAPLPDGVIARMQFTPYRLQLAGIATVPIGYRPLARELDAPARVVEPGEGAKTAVTIDLFPSERVDVRPGQAVVFTRADGDPLRGVVTAVPEAGDAPVTAELAGAPGVPVGTALRATVLMPIDGREPFRSMPAGAPALRAGEPRRIYSCGDHPETIATAAGTCPKDGKPLGRNDLATNQRVRWWCPMHPAVTADVAGRTCDACGGMVLVPRVVTYRPPGEVLAVPESAVLDTGTRRVAYVERMPGMFDGVEVVLGPRCGAWYPVVRGLEPGQRVVASGAFLVDAESRLNPSVATAYFGASGRPAIAPPPSSTVATAANAATSGLDALPPADRAIATRQRICPVTGKPLGSMGTPVRVDLGGRPVFVCCAGCEPALRGDAKRYLAKLAGPAAP